LPTITADRYRMQQLFQNIISNAISCIDKPEGIVEIDFEETNENYIFSVKDNGSGIAKEHQEKIFNIFQSYSSVSKSTGFGLSIVNKIIEIYDGRIWLESDLGIGTTFYIELKKNKI